MTNPNNLHFNKIPCNDYLNNKYIINFKFVKIYPIFEPHTPTFKMPAIAKRCFITYNHTGYNSTFIRTNI